MKHSKHLQFKNKNESPYDFKIMQGVKNTMKKRISIIVSILLILTMICIPVSYSAQENTAAQAGARAMYDVDEGIYYLRNKATGMYATVNAPYQTVYMNPLLNNKINQLWAIRISDFDFYYYMYNGVLLENYRLTQGTIDSATNKASVILTAGTSNPNYKIVVSQLNDGSCYITSELTSDYVTRYLQVPASGASTLLEWAPFDSSNADAQKWYLEKADYKSGDVNMDGYINTEDITYLQNYLVDNESLSGVQLYLADFNQDGVININDATAIQLFMNKPLIRINGQQYHKGATFRYTLEYSCTSSPVASLQGTVSYNSDAVAFDADSIEFFRIGSPVYNASTPGTIRFNNSSINPFDLNGLAPIMTAEFTVPEDTTVSETVINFVMNDLYDINFNSLKGKQKVTITELGF